MTDFQRLVYAGLRDVPKGYVTTYTALAAHIGKPHAVRALGTALSKNTKIGEIPCHRVVRSDGSVGQFALGTKKKIAMLSGEGVSITNGKVNLSEQGIYFDV